jgi:tRNA-splicing ligase RtcB (3'-phosphate/5'-hydroxy nucleic acid ligase)
VVWVVLHSGSRNIGKELAEFHIGQVQKLAHNQDLPDRNLAVFIGTHRRRRQRGPRSQV